MIRTSLLTAFLLLTLLTHAQSTLMVAFYNQENLFDTIDDPERNDNEFLPSAKKAWNSDKYAAKLANMARVIASMNNGKGPDVLGMCEVENRAVLQDLIQTGALKGMNYGIVHFESPDERSIDNALIYKKNVFTVTAEAPYRISLSEFNDAKTRDIVMAKLVNRKKQSLIVLVNHFPSRLGGQEASEPKRIAAALVLKHIIDSVAKADAGTPVIAMGDFNDEPTNSSMDSVLQARDNSEAGIFNAMYSLKQKGEGSHMYQKHWTMLDQILITQNAVNCRSPYCYVTQSAAIYKQEWMLETDEKYKGAPLRTFAGNKYLNGYSDHLPVYILLKQK